MAAGQATGGPCAAAPEETLDSTEEGSEGSTCPCICGMCAGLPVECGLVLVCMVWPSELPTDATQLGAGKPMTVRGLTGRAERQEAARGTFAPGALNAWGAGGSTSGCLQASRRVLLGSVAAACAAAVSHGWESISATLIRVCGTRSSAEDRNCAADGDTPAGAAIGS